MRNLTNFMTLKNFICNYITNKRKKINTIKDANKPNILVVSTTGLGDSLWGTPAIHSIRKKYPTCYLAILTNKIGEEVYRNNPNINDIFVIKTSNIYSITKQFFILKKKI